MSCEATEFTYLAVVPRGLEDVVCRSLQRQAKKVLHRSPDARHSSVEGRILDVSFWYEDLDAETGRQALQQIMEKENEKKLRAERTQQLPPSEPSISYENGTATESAIESRVDTHGEQRGTWLPAGVLSGSIPLNSSGQHISVGFTTKLDGGVEPCWSCPGQLTGSMWLRLSTREEVISRSVISASRCMGPLLALVTVQEDNACLSPSNYHTHSLNDICDEVSRHVNDTNKFFDKRIRAAIRVWKDCVSDQWKDQLQPAEFQDLISRIGENQLKFRLSCLRQTQTPRKYKRGRNAKSESTDFVYSRQDLCRALMDRCGRKLAPAYYDENRKSTTGGGSWTISLEDFDLEFVFIILAGYLAIGISLRPYSFLKSKSFAFGGIPPDVTRPFLGGGVLCEVVKLKSTTAHLLLEAADLHDYEIVLDPCAGVGTIPLEADRYFCESSCVGLGGDLALSNPAVAKVAALLNSRNIMTVWDGSHLPIRTACIDAIVSDLPFGQQCLSTHELNQLLPALFLECARVLLPGSGRMLLMCGGTPQGVFDLLQSWSATYWKRPVRRASPVNIGGLLAWIILVERNQHTFSYEEFENTRQYLGRIRSIARKREQIGRQCKSDVIQQKNIKRRRSTKS